MAKLQNLNRLQWTSRQVVIKNKQHNSQFLSQQVKQLK